MAPQGEYGPQHALEQSMMPTAGPWRPIFPVDDAIRAVVGEKVRPFLQPVVVDGMRVIRDQVFDFPAHIGAQIY